VAAVGFRIFDFSSDVGVEADDETVADALIELGRGMASIITDGSHVHPRESREVDVEGDKDIPGTAVAFLNELVFLFDTSQFLLSEGEITVKKDGDVHRVRGKLWGERFDPKTHNAGRGVKAATYHDATYQVSRGMHRIRIVLDL
jgi:SHS2 domain-containing protein